MHVRTQIRAAVAALLTGLATTGERVYIGRTRPLGNDHEPTLLIYTQSEKIAPFSLRLPRTLLHTLTLSVLGRVVDTAPRDDVLDQIEAEVRVKVATDPTLGGLVKSATLITAIFETQAQGEQHIGGVRLEYSIVYSTKEDAPEIAG